MYKTSLAKPSHRRQSKETARDTPRIDYAVAQELGRASQTLLSRRLADPNNHPQRLTTPTGKTWSSRHVTKPQAHKYLTAVNAWYLAGRSKNDAGKNWTGHLCAHVYRQAHGLPWHTPVTKLQKNRVGDHLNYLGALGILIYRPAKGNQPAHLEYGQAVHALTNVTDLGGGVLQFWSTGSTPVLEYSLQEGLQEENSKAIRKTAAEKPVPKAVKQAVTLTPEGVTLLTAFTDHLKGVAKGHTVAAELEATAGKHARLVRLLNETGQACGEAVTAGVTNAYGLARRTVTEAGDTGRPNDLTATETPARLLGHLLETQAGNITAVLEKETRRQRELATAGADTHGAYKTELVRDANGREYLTPVVEVAAAIEAVETPLEKENARRYSKAPAAALNALASHVDGYATVQPDTATLEGIEQATAVTELTPAYLTEPPLRGRIVADAVRQAKHFGGLTGVDAERLHAAYLERRAAGNLWADTDLAVLEKELGRPLHLAECALYDLAVSVSVVGWERVEAGEPPPVGVRSVVTV
jgi:hypothetical protein